MSDQPPAHHDENLADIGDGHTALFAQLVLQQSNMALMFLGKTGDPAGEKVERNLDAAKMFIDQLEMLQAKTKGNLSKQEEALLKQTLMPLRLAFVEAVEAEPQSGESAAAPTDAAAEAGKASETGQKSEPEESRKKFSKKY